MGAKILVGWERQPPTPLQIKEKRKSSWAAAHSWVVARGGEGLAKAWFNRMRGEGKDVCVTGTIVVRPPEANTWVVGWWGCPDGECHDDPSKGS